MKKTMTGIMAVLILSACMGPNKPLATNQPETILLNQVGYSKTSTKKALVMCAASKFEIKDTLGNSVLSGTLGERRFWPYSGDSASIADFSELAVPEILLVVNDTIVSHPILVSASPYAEVGNAAIKGLYYNRTAMAIDSQYGGKWARPASHPDTIVYIHASAASKQRQEGTVVSSPLGWYDAGDYNKYVVNSSISTYTLLKAMEDFTPYITAQNLNIPESSNQLSDLLDETLFNLKWVITMQDPNDGGVYHKLTNKGFDGMIMPHEATEKRYLVMKTTAATLDYAALLAKAARTLAPWSNQLPGLVDQCKANAIKAWDYAVKHPNLIYIQPEDIKTGTYGDDKIVDEWYWAACEMWLTTGDAKYIPTIKENYKNWGVPSWDVVGTLGTLSLLNDNSSDLSLLGDLSIKTNYLSMVDSLLNDEQQSAFGVSIGKFAWGSNSDVANHGMLKLFAYKLTNDKKYLQSAINDADYILGRNATGFCFVTGFGSKQVVNLHHRPSAADGVAEPVPGLLSAPNLATFDDCGTKVERSKYPAKSFVDEVCSYSTNEIAINWNAPLAYLMNGLSASLK